MRLDASVKCYAAVIMLVSALSVWSDDDPHPFPTRKPLVDFYGDLLPDGAVMRLGTVRLRHDGSVRCVAWSPDGNTLASGGEDKVVRLWDPITGKLFRTCLGHEHTVCHLAWSPNGKVPSSAPISKSLVP
jgi:WD40 repeat protein